MKCLDTEVEKNEKDDAPNPLDEDDVLLLKTYGACGGIYASRIAILEENIEEQKQRIRDLVGIRESDTGLLPTSQWDIVGDSQLMSQESPLQVATCSKIIEPITSKNTEAADKQEAGTTKYVVEVPHMAKFVVGLGERVAPTDIEEGMRVGIDRANYTIQLPLPSRVDASVSLMSVEERPDVTYEDIGGADDAMEKLREVMELPLLHPDRFLTLGIDPPKGVLLFGPPGAGAQAT